MAATTKEIQTPLWVFRACLPATREVRLGDIVDVSGSACMTIKDIIIARNNVAGFLETGNAKETIAAIERYLEKLDTSVCYFADNRSTYFGADRHNCENSSKRTS